MMREIEINDYPEKIWLFGKREIGQDESRQDGSN
jgi:hypothetical protein